MISDVTYVFDNVQNDFNEQRSSCSTANIYFYFPGGWEPLVRYAFRLNHPQSPGWPQWILCCSGELTLGILLLKWADRVSPKSDK